MRNQERVINNADRISNRINSLSLVGVESVGDDGSVCIQVSGNENRVLEVVHILESNPNINVSEIGDGVQWGSLWINGIDCDIHCELSDVEDELLSSGRVSI